MFSYLLFIYYGFLDFKPFIFFIIFQMNAASFKKHMACSRITRKSNGNGIVIFIQFSPYDDISAVLHTTFNFVPRPSPLTSKDDWG